MPVTLSARETTRDVVVHPRLRSGAPGKTLGSVRRCQLEGCSGVRVTVRWSDGTITYPCSKGLEWNDAEGCWIIV